MAARYMIRLRHTLSTNDQFSLVKEYREVWNYAGNVYRNAQSDYEEARFWFSEHDASVNHLSAVGHKRLASIKPLLEKKHLFPISMFGPCVNYAYQPLFTQTPQVFKVKKKRKQ